MSNELSPSRAHMQRLAKVKLLAIVFFCALPMVLASFFYYAGWGSAPSMVGELIAKPLPSVVWRNSENQTVDFAAMRQWKLLMITPTVDCSDACKQHAYWLKQLHVAQGEAQKRMSRWWLVQNVPTTTENTRVSVVTDKGLGQLHFESSSVQELQSFYHLLAGEHADPAAYFYLIDPHNNVVMRYNTDMDRTKVMREIAKILKNNERIG